MRGVSGWGIGTIMRMLGIETASEACSVALFEDGVPIAHDHRVLGRGHAEQLVPMIAALPEKGRADAIRVSLGPGSFTGVRIGIATARALAFAWQAELLGYPTLALVAAMALAERREAVTVCATGGHGEWFVQDFAADGTATCELQSLTPGAAAARPAHGQVAGSQAQALADRLAPGASIAQDLLPDARAIALLGSAHFTTSLAPIYGRAPDARLPGSPVAPA